MSDLPKEGERIFYRHKDQKKWRSGKVTCVWNALGYVAIDVNANPGTATIIPTFGDEWQPTAP